MDRRKFLQGAAALFAAPAIVRAESLMPIYVPPQNIETLGAVDVYVGEFSTVQVVPAVGGLTEGELIRVLEDVWRRGGEPDVAYRVDVGIWGRRS